MRELANRPKETGAELDARLADLRARGATTLHCIEYVRRNHYCSLKEGVDIVINSAAWIDQKEAIMRHQEEMFNEMLEDCRDDIKEIHWTITPNGLDVRVEFKSSAESTNETADDCDPLNPPE